MRNTAPVSEEVMRKRCETFQSKNRDRVYSPGETIKAAITHDGMTEHIWMVVVTTDTDYVICTLDNDPVHLPLKHGESVMVKRDTISAVFDPNRPFEHMPDEVLESMIIQGKHHVAMKGERWKDILSDLLQLQEEERLRKEENC